MTKTAVGYTRLSQDSDTSIERQKRHIRSYCDEHDFNVARIYDDGEHSSGFESEREEYRQLRADISESDDLDAVVTNDKRRLARDIDEVMRLVPDLRQRDVELHTYSDGQLDLSDPMRAAIEILQAAAAHQEKMREIEKAIESVEERIEAGHDHGRPRFGMRYNDDGTRQVPGERFDTVERIWQLRDEGLSMGDISDAVGVSKSVVHGVISDKDWYQERVAATNEQEVSSS